MKFTKIPADTFKKLQLNAGMLATVFTPATGELEEQDIVGATTGGIAFAAAPEYADFGEDIDNCPANMKELKVLDSWEITISGTLVTMDTKAAKILIGPADIDTSDPTKVKPRNSLLQTDFTDLWIIGDYSDVNDDGSSTGKAGFIAIHMMNSLSTGGFSLQSNDAGKGNFEFEFTGHFSMKEQETVPFEIYIKSGTSDEE